MGKRKTIVAVLVAALMAMPLAAWAFHRFEDVPNSNVFHDDIAWLADSGVTFGCNPPENTRFCPSENVTREQMAAFMRRLSEAQVVDAATAIEADHAAEADLASSAESATSAEHAASADSAVSADDADMLDGKDGVAYETRTAGDYCQFASEQVCPSVASPGGPYPTGSPLLSVEVDAPAPGALIINTHAQFNGQNVKWLSVGNNCGPFLEPPTPPTTFPTLIPNGVPGTISGNFLTPGLPSGAPSAVVEVDAGSHTVQLCAATPTPGGPGTPEVLGATLTASWVQSSGGIPVTVSNTDSAEGVPQEFVDAVKEAFGDN